MRQPKNNLVGQRFERLVVLSFIGRNKHHLQIYECQCDCGKIIKTIGSYLKCGDTKSCGCYGAERLRQSRFKHGFAHKNNPEYEIWKGMKARCYNKNHVRYDLYGQRGITVCERWKDSFLNFLADMGTKPTKSHSLERKDNEKGYSPENCKWATDAEQSRNKRNNRIFSRDGKTMIMEDWAKYFNVHQSTLIEHLETKSFDRIYDHYSNDRKLTRF